MEKSMKIKHESGLLRLDQQHELHIEKISNHFQDKINKLEREKDNLQSQITKLRRQTNFKSPSNDSSASQENRPKSRPKPIKPASNYYSISAVQISGIYAYIMLYEDIMINPH